MLIQYRVAELKEYLVDSVEEKEILETHTELKHTKMFAEWVEHIGEAPLRRPKQPS